MGGQAFGLNHLCGEGYSWTTQSMLRVTLLRTVTDQPGSKVGWGEWQIELLVGPERGEG